MAGPQLLARGPWAVGDVVARWRDEHFDAPAAAVAAADAQIEALRDRGSPAHDGLGARYVGHALRPDGVLEVELQPLRWALRLVPGDAQGSVSALCVVRDEEGRWLAGRRAAWLSSWAGRWALGAGGAVDVGESPAETLARELQEEWALTAERVQGEALIALPSGLVMFVGQAWVASAEGLVRDPEHDAHAWWPASIDDWPPEADEPLRRVAALVA